MIGQEILELQSNALNESSPGRELAYAKVAIDLTNTDTSRLYRDISKDF